jgi:hypothetical protein
MVKEKRGLAPSGGQTHVFPSFESYAALRITRKYVRLILSFGQSRQLQLRTRRSVKISSSEHACDTYLITDTITMSSEILLYLQR